MGLFSRKKSEHTSRSASRTATSSEAQAAELRGRARRRLVGALVLVLAAIIVVPMMFDDDTASQQPDTPVVLPAIIPPVPEPELAGVTSPDYSIDEPVLSGDVAAIPEQTETDPGAPAAAIAAPAESQQPLPETGVPPAPDAAATSSEPQPSTADARPEPSPTAPERPEPSQSPAKPAPADTRTDDGSVALALLEGRVPTAGGAGAPAQEQGKFILQIAAYSTEADAQTRRSSLVDAGVTNAYVERGLSNDKTTYRLRVGSFPTRDAAQAAQARLRALGYDNSLLLTQ